MIKTEYGWRPLQCESLVFVGLVNRAYHPPMPTLSGEWHMFLNRTGDVWDYADTVRSRLPRVDDLMREIECASSATMRLRTGDFLRLEERKMNWYGFAAFWICILTIPGYALLQEKFADRPIVTQQDRVELKTHKIRGMELTCPDLEKLRLDAVFLAINSNSHHADASVEAYASEIERRCKVNEQNDYDTREQINGN